MFGDLVLTYYPTLLKTRKINGRREICECDCESVAVGSEAVGWVRAIVIPDPPVVKKKPTS